MKLFIQLVFFMLVFTISSYSQIGRGKITAAEYYFDTDPGQGAATAMTLQGNLNDDMRTAIQTGSQSLSAGKHTINVRLKDSLGHWGPVFKTTLSVENAATGRNLSMALARVYWDANVAGAVNMIILNGNAADAINTFVTTSPLNTFSTPGSHKINVQVMGADGNYSAVFTTMLKVESLTTFNRIISASLARFYWDNNLSSQVNLIMLNGSVGNAMNEFITSSALSTFSSSGSHKINVQMLDPNGGSNYGPLFTTTLKVESPLTFTGIISAALGRAWWDNNLGTQVGLIILNGNAGNAVNEFVTASPIQSYGVSSLHKLNVQLLDPNGSGNYSPTFSTAISFEDALDSVRAIRVDAARVWLDGNIGSAISMLAFDGNFNQAIETAVQTLSPSAGLHTLSVQMRDSLPTHWGPTFKTSFVVESPIAYRNINVATGQLYWDNDTNNNPVTLLAFDGSFDNAIESALKSGVSTPGVGLHTICARFKDVANNWSNPFRLSITIEDSLFARNIKLVQGEVRVDNTPPLTIVALNGSFNAALEQTQTTILSSGIPAGLHRLLVRIKGLDNNWGPYFIAPILISPCASTPTPTVTHSRPLEFCHGDSTVLTANSGYSSYTWVSNNTVVGTGASFVAKDSGNYVVIVTDATNCPGPSLPVIVNAHTPVVNITTSPVFCAGTSDSLFATAGFNSYVWSAGSTTRKQFINASGTYSVTVTDAYGCTATSSINMTALPQPPIPVITANGPLNFCPGSNVTLTSSATTNILWNNGLTIPSFTTDTTGNYSVTVTGANGCKSTSAVTHTVKSSAAAAAISANGPTTICNGNSVLLSAGPAVVYNWSNGTHSSTLNVTTSGTYSLSIVDSNGCTANSNSITVTVNPIPAIPTISASGPLSFCNGGSVILTSSAASNNTWNNGINSQSQTVYLSGTFVDTVSNQYGCKSWSAPTVVNVHPVASISASGPTTFCFGGSVTLSASPVSGVSYLWSTGATTPSITVSSTQNISMIATETGFGCKDTAFTNVLVHPLPTGSIAAAGPTTVCDGTSITLNATGSPHVSFRWYKNGSPISYLFYNYLCGCYNTIYVYGTSLAVSSAGSYSVEITDSVTGCVSMSNAVNCNFILPPQPVITANGGTTLCIGANTILSSTPAVSYLWSTGAVTQSITASTQGNYQVTITDINGCTRASNLTPVTFFPVASITSSGPTTFCAGNNVSLTAHPTGTYLWTNGSTNATISNITTSGSYGVSVTDVNGCTSSVAPVNVVVNPLPTGSIVAGGPTTVCDGNTAIINTNPTPHTIYKWYKNGSAIYYLSYLYTCNCYVPVYTYGYSFGATTSGTYSAEIIDTLTGCSSMSNSIAITVLPLPTPSISQTAFIPCYGGSNAALSANATGTVSPYTYLWNTGSSNQNISGLAAATYTVQVTDHVGCSNSTTYTVNQPGLVVASASSPTNTRGYNVTCFGSTNGSASVSPSGGTAPYTYLWSTGATTSGISGIGAGTYTVTVKDANNCATATATVTLTQPAAVSVTASPHVFYGGKNISCYGGSNGSITAIPAGGTANFTYAWSNGQTSQVASGLTIGTYSVIATDSVGCTGTASATLTQPTILNATLTPSVFSGYNVSCHGSQNGSITLTPTGGISPYHYTWTDTVFTQNRSALKAGTYRVTISDTLGCVKQDSIVLIEPTAINTTMTGSLLNCYGDSNGVATVNVTGGNSPYTYAWDNGATTSINNNLKANYYLVTVTDVRGCTKVDQVQVTQPTQVTAYAFGTYIGCGTQIGLLSVTGSGGNGPYTFLWNNGSTASFQTNQPLGNYSVTVTDTHGCWDTSNAIILSPPAINATMSADFHASCDSITTTPAGSLSVSVSGGVTPYLYLWSNGETTSSINQLGTGAYTCIVTDANGCTATPTGHIYNNDPAVILGDTIICTGGGIQTTLSTIPSNSYTWSNAGGVISTAQSVNVGVGNYTLTATNLNGCINSSSVHITSGQCNAVLNLKLYLQSYYAASGLMTPVLMNQGVGSNPNLTDTIEVQLRLAHPPYSLVASKKTLLNTDGTAHCVFPPIIGSYYIAINHRSTLQTWSADSVTVGIAPAYYDFSNASSKSYGDNVVQVDNNIWAFYSGDVNHDENLDLLDLILVDLGILNFDYGYKATDLNGDGNVDLLDPVSIEDNILNYIFASHP